MLLSRQTHLRLERSGQGGALLLRRRTEHGFRVVGVEGSGKRKSRHRRRGVVAHVQLRGKLGTLSLASNLLFLRKTLS